MIAAHYYLNYNEDPYTLARKVKETMTVTVRNAHQIAHQEEVNSFTMFHMFSGDILPLNQFLKIYENKSLETMLAMRDNGHIDRDANGNDITDLNYLKHRRRECKEKGIPFDSEKELQFFRDNWNKKPQGRKPKGQETRKAISFRLQPSTIALIREAADTYGISQSDVIENLVNIGR